MKKFVAAQCAKSISVFHFSFHIKPSQLGEPKMLGNISGSDFSFLRPALGVFLSILLLLFVKLSFHHSVSQPHWCANEQL